METTDPYLFLAMHQAKAILRLATVAEAALAVYVTQVVCRAALSVFRAIRDHGRDKRAGA